MINQVYQYGTAVSYTHLALLTTTTGGAAAYGESIKAGAELAVSEINADANAVKINLLVEDTKGDKNEAINAMNKVISKDKVVAVIGPMLSGEMMAAGPVANKSKIVALGTSCLLYTSTNKGTSVNELITRFRTISGTDFMVYYENERIGDIKHSRLSNVKAERDFGFIATTTLEAGLQKTLEYFKAHHK